MRAWIRLSVIVSCTLLAGIGVRWLLDGKNTESKLDEHLNREMDQLKSDGLLDVPVSLAAEGGKSGTNASALYIQFLESFFGCLRSDSAGDFDRFLQFNTVSSRLLETVQHADGTLALLDRANKATGRVAFFDVRKGLKDPAVGSAGEFLRCAQLLRARASQCVATGQYSKAWEIGMALITAADRLQSGGAALEQSVCSSIRSNGHACLIGALEAWQPSSAQASDAINVLEQSDECTSLGWGRLRCSFIRVEVWFQDLLAHGSGAMLPSELSRAGNPNREEIEKAWATWIELSVVCPRGRWSPGEAVDFLQVMKEAAANDQNLLSRWVVERAVVEFDALRLALSRDRIVTAGVLRGCELAQGDVRGSLDHGDSQVESSNSLSLGTLRALWKVSEDSESMRSVIQWKPDEAHEFLLEVGPVDDIRVRMQ